MVYRVDIEIISSIHVEAKNQDEAYEKVYDLGEEGILKIVNNWVEDINLDVSDPSTFDAIAQM